MLSDILAHGSTMLRTALTERLGIEHPILQGGMAWVATWELVVAVSRAGALGILGAGNAPVEWVRQHVAAIQAAGVTRYGVNIPLFSPYETSSMTRGPNA